MSDIPKELLWFSQMFGALPLTYSKTPKNGPSLVLSKTLYLKNVVVMILLIVMSTISLWVDYDASLRGKPLRMIHTTNVIAVFLDVIFLNLMSVAVFVSNLRKYSRFINLFHILERIDRCLRLPTSDHRSWKWKVSMMGSYITFIIVHSQVMFLLSVGWKGVWHTFDQLHYYVQGALFLQFTFITDSFTKRFSVINQMIEREVVSRQRVKRALLPSIVPVTEGYLLDDRIKLLIDSYSRLCEAVQQANHFYSSQLFAALSSSFIHNIITLYFFIQEIRPSFHVDNDSTNTFNEFIWVLFHVVYLILLVWPCTQLTETVSETAPMICRLLSRKVDLRNSAVRLQLETFLLELLHYNVGFSALGFFEIQNYILTSIASSVTTYLVIMIQFRSDNS